MVRALLGESFISLHHLREADEGKDQKKRNSLVLGNNVPSEAGGMAGLGVDS